MRYPQVHLRVKKMEDSHEPLILLEVSRQVVLAIHRLWADKAGISVPDILSVALGFHPVACEQMRKWYADFVIPLGQARWPSLKINFSAPPGDDIEIQEEIPALDGETWDTEDAL